MVFDFENESGVSNAINKNAASKRGKNARI
jgi:hypothetical protein